MSTEKRTYRQRARAQSAEATREKVFAAAETRFGEDPFDRVSLKDIAKSAGVGLQTVIRFRLGDRFFHCGESSR